MTSKSLFVIDTNVLLSFLLFFNSVPGSAVSKANKIGILCFSDETFSELKEVLFRKKFDRYLSNKKRHQFLIALAEKSNFHPTPPKISICRDPKDNKFLSLAKEVKANYIISGDQDLLVLNPFQGIEILSPKDFLNV